MERASLSRAYLESLTTSDLTRIADDLGVDIPDNPERIAIIEELLEITTHDEEEPADFQESEIAGSDIIESVPIPKQYNISFIEIMIRDPLWAFVFWEIKSSDREQFEKAENFDGYYLKVSRLGIEANHSKNGSEELFTVQVKPEDLAWYLNLSPAFEDETPWAAQSQYKVEFCAGSGGFETVLASSKPVRLPGLPVLSSGAGRQGPLENKLVSLSGYGDFHVLRKRERPLRLKRGEGDNSNE